MRRRDRSIRGRKIIRNDETLAEGTYLLRYPKLPGDTTEGRNKSGLYFLRRNE